jgi:hypothetical protein
MPVTKIKTVTVSVWSQPYVKEPGEASGFVASFYICILHSKVTNTLLEDSPILATGGEYK